MREGCDAEGSETDMKDDEPLSDMLVAEEGVAANLRYVTASVCTWSSRCWVVYRCTGWTRSGASTPVQFLTLKMQSK